MGIKKLALKLILGSRADSNSYIKHLRKLGFEIGENVTINCPWNFEIDKQRPWMIKIGNNVVFSNHVTIFQHGYDWCVLKNKYGDVVGSAGKVIIGNNVFVGARTTILKGVTIGDNVIIGGGSLVAKDCLEEGVYAGVPCKKISNLDDYLEKRKNKQLEEAFEVFELYYKHYGKIPDKTIFREFFFLFENEPIENLNEVFTKVLYLADSYDKSCDKYKTKNSLFNNYDEFVSYCMQKIDKDK